MKVIDKSGTTIQIKGLIQYDPDLEFELGDLVIGNDNNIYHCDVEVIKGEEPSVSNKFTHYYLRNAFDPDKDNMNSSDSDNKLITVSTIKEILNNFIEGVQYNGRLKVLDLTTGISLDDYLHTCVYKIVFDSEDDLPGLILIKDIKEALFYTYETNDSIVQYLLDYTTPAVYIRVLDTKTKRPIHRWNCIAANGKDTLSAYINSLNRSSEKANELKSQLSTIRKELSKGYYYDFVDASRGINEAKTMFSWPTDYTCTVKLFYSYIHEGIRYQDSIDLDNSNEGTTLCDSRLKSVRFLVEVIKHGNMNVSVHRATDVSDLRIDRVLITKAVYKDQLKYE